MAEIKKVYIARAKDDGTPIDNPVAVSLCAKEIGLKGEKKYIDMDCLLSRTSKKVAGSIEYSGSITPNMTKQIMPILATLFYGDADTTTDITTATWSADTTMSVGDQVNHSDGKHTLTVIRVKGDGKTGSAEPTLTKTNQEEVITDNNVVWASSPKIVKSKYTYKTSAPKFVLEYEIDDNGTSFYKRFLGCELATLPIKADAGSDDRTFACDVKPSSSLDSTVAEWATPLVGIAGAKVVESASDYYSADEDLLSALIAGNADCMDAVELTLDKGIEAKKVLNKCNIFKRQEKIEGSIDLDFTIPQYERFKHEDLFPLEIKFSDVGVYSSFTFPNVRAESAEPDLKTKTEVLLSPKINVEDNGGILASAEIVAPSLIDNNGDIVTF